MKLYRVAIQTYVYVMATDPRHAEVLAEEGMADGEIDHFDYFSDATPTNDVSRVNKKWHDCIPFGEGNRTIDQILAVEEKTEEPKSEAAKP